MIDDGPAAAYALIFVRNILTRSASNRRKAIVITSRITSKAQTTVPKPVREALGVREGDEIAYAVEEGRVVLTKALRRRARPGRPEDDPFAAFSEWDTEADRRAYANL